jgi:succinoglycan biosynthesis transport protein ExoP
MDFVRLFRLIVRYKWLLLAVVALGTTGTWFGARFKGVIYQGTATLMLQEQALQTMEGPAVLSSSLGSEQMQQVPAQLRKSRVDSLIALMMSPKVLAAVIAKVGIQATPADLEGMLHVEQVTPEVLRIRAISGSPEMAGELANGLASTFVQFYGDLSTNAITESTRMLRQQEAQAGKELSKCKDGVSKYKASHGISSLTEQLSGVLSRLNAVRQDRDQTINQQAQLDALLREAEAQLAKTPQIIRVVEKSNDSPAAQQLREQVAVLERDLALERGAHTEMHPRVQELKAKLESANSRLHQEEGRMIERVRQTANPTYTTLQQRCGDLQAQRDGLIAKAGSLGHNMSALQREMKSYTGADVQLAGLMQRYNQAEQRYSSVLMRLRQAEANADSIRRSSAIAIVDTSGPTNPPADISEGKARKLTMAAFFLSLALSLFLLAAWDYLDRRVRTSADAEALVELPVAGIVPRALPRAASTPLPQIAALMPASPEAEAYRFLSLHLLLSRDENPVRALMMATARPGQGATTTISNLAATLAQGNRRVILVDADLRRPSLHQLFEVENKVGLTSVLAEGLPLEQALQPTVVPNLALLTAGPPVDNPWVLLRSAAMEELVQQLRQAAHFVLIDTPSAAAFADAFGVAPLVDGVFMVVRSRYQPTGIEMKIKGMFEEAGVKVFGAILNDVPINNIESCRYHKDYYANGTPAVQPSQIPALTAGKS